MCRFLEKLERWEIDGRRPLAAIEFEQAEVDAVRRVETLLAWCRVTDKIVHARLAEIAVNLWFRDDGKWVCSVWYKGFYGWAPSDLAVNVAGEKVEVEVKSGPHPNVAIYKAIAHPARPFTEPGMPRIGDYLIGVSTDRCTDGRVVAVIWGAIKRERLETVPTVLTKRPQKTPEHDDWYPIPLDWFEASVLTELRESASRDHPTD